jgi:AcrR family transcriptional regulator
MSQRTNKHEQILDSAEKLFSMRGYDSVRLSDITAAVGAKHSAIYYYAPQGKEQLYVQVMERSLNKHRRGMADAIAAAAPDLTQQLWAVASWLLDHPPLNVARMEQSDFAALSEANELKLSNMIFDSLRLPLSEALNTAQQRGTIHVADVDLAALSFIALVQSIHATTNPFLLSRKRDTIAAMIDMLMQGWLPR